MSRLEHQGKTLLRTDGLNRYFGKFAAIHDLSFDVQEGEIFGIAGPNGAGKSTLFNVITHIPFGPSGGKIFLDDRDITHKKPFEICKLGIARTFQVPRNFRTLTVTENLLIGSYYGRAEKSDSVTKEVNEVLSFVGLLPKANIIADRIPLLDMKLLMIASALVMKPRLLMLDEPIGGLNRGEIELLMEMIRKINRRGVTVLLIEHVMKALMGLSDRVMIMNFGEKIAEGKPEEVANDQSVVEAYLGDRYLSGRGP
jgi:branched-chain amino acid transport system ATP-binding protein